MLKDAGIIQERDDLELLVFKDVYEMGTWENF